MHVHIAPVGINPVPVMKVLNRVDGIDKLYLLYTVPKDKDYDPKSRYLEKKYESMNNTSSNMPSDISGTTNFVSDEDSNVSKTKKKYTSKELAEEIKKNNEMGIREIVLVKTDMFSFDKTVDVITKIYEKEKGKGVTFSVNITSGTKVMSCATCYSSYFTGAVMYYAGETEGSIEESVPPITPPKPVDVSKYKPMTKDILRYIFAKTNDDDSEVVTTTEIANNLYDNKILDKQRVAHHIKLLRGDGLITKDEEHLNKREVSLKITNLGRWSMPNL